MWKNDEKKKYCYKSLWLQGILRLWSIIHETRAYQDSEQSFTRLGHIKIQKNHLQDIGMLVLRFARLEHIKTRLIICKTLGISRLIDQSFARLGQFKTPINHGKPLAYPYSDHLQDLGYLDTISHSQDRCVTGYWLGIKYTCTTLRYKPSFIVTW